MVLLRERCSRGIPFVGHQQQSFLGFCCWDFAAGGQEGTQGGSHWGWFLLQPPRAPSCRPHFSPRPLLTVSGQPASCLSFLLNPSLEDAAALEPGFGIAFCSLLLGFLFYFFFFCLLKASSAFLVPLSRGQECIVLWTVRAKSHPSFLFSITSIDEDEQSPQTNGNVQNCYTTELIYLYRKPCMKCCYCI